MGERFSSVDRIVGGTPDQKKDAESYTVDLFEKQEQIDGEREKSPEELKIIDLANEATDLLRKQYGQDAFPIPQQNIHVLNEEKMGGKHGIAKQGEQAIHIRETSVLTEFATTTVHEMLHFKSFEVWKILDERSLVGSRGGMTVTDTSTHRKMFLAFDEAITEKLTKQIMIELRSHPLLISESNEIKKILDSEHGEELLNLGQADEFVSLKERGSGIEYKTFGYLRERAALALLVDKIFQRNQETYKDSEEVFDLFVRNYFTGKAGKFGQLFDSTFGPGTYRRLAKCDDNIDALEKLINEL